MAVQVVLEELLHVSELQHCFVQHKMCPYEDSLKLMPLSLHCIPSLKEWSITPDLEEKVPEGPALTGAAITTNAHRNKLLCIVGN